MQSLLKFIQKYSNFLVFLALEVVAFLLLTSNNEYPKSSVLSTANSIAAFNYKVADDVVSYFQLRSTNTILAQENAELRNRVTELENLLEDSVEQSGYTYAHLDIRYIPARVVYANTNRVHNYLTINKGERDGVYVGMGVRNHEGVVGIVKTVGNKFSVVIPVINTNSHTSVKFAKNGYCGTISWDGVDYRYAQLVDIASHVSVLEGDTILTSGLSALFPADIPMAIVDKAELKEGDSYYTIRVRLATDFRKIDYVQLIDNKNYQEQEAIQDALD